jgi:hypothetical protein
MGRVHSSNGVAVRDGVGMSDRLGKIRKRADVLAQETPWLGRPGVIHLSTQMRDLYVSDLDYLLDRLRIAEAALGLTPKQTETP